MKKGSSRPSIVMSGFSESEKKQYFGIVLAAKEGHIGETCKSLGITRYRYRKWMEEDPEFAEHCQDAMEGLLDLAQSKLVENIKDNVSKDIQFLLKTQGRHRGYGDKVEHEHTGMIGHAHMIGHYPPEPKTIAEWEKQVEDARKLREGHDNALTEGANEHSDSPIEVTSDPGSLNTGPVPRALSPVPA